MILPLLRMLVLAGLVYGGYAVAFPDWEGTLYHATVLPAIAGAAVGAFVLIKFLDLGTGAAKLAIELGFVAGVAVFVGYTLPQKSGKSPIAQWAEGARPRRDDARRGLERLGLDPGGTLGKPIVKLFPR